MNGLKGGDIDMALYWDGRAYSFIDDGNTEFKCYSPDPGVVVAMTWIQKVKNSSPLGFQFANFALSASVGEGGGSIASVDRLGVLKVGPESAGSRPGPACYGRGGTHPTITDAFAACGMVGLAEVGYGAGGGPAASPTCRRCPPISRPSSPRLPNDDAVRGVMQSSPYWWDDAPPTTLPHQDVLPACAHTLRRVGFSPPHQGPVLDRGGLERDSFRLTCPGVALSLRERVG